MNVERLRANWGVRQVNVVATRVTLSDSRCGTFTQSAMADDLEPDEDASKDEFMFND